MSPKESVFYQNTIPIAVGEIVTTPKHHKRNPKPKVQGLAPDKNYVIIKDCATTTMSPFKLNKNFYEASSIIENV